MGSGLSTKHYFDGSSNDWPRNEENQEPRPLRRVNGCGIEALVRRQTKCRKAGIPDKKLVNGVSPAFTSKGQSGTAGYNYSLALPSSLHSWLKSNDSRRTNVQ